MHEPFGKYVLTDKVSSGGMGEVYRAHFRTIDGFRKTVAVKRILPSYSAERNFQRMFAKEAKIAAMLSHTNIVQTYDFGKVGENYFLAMEYIVGWSLREVYDRCEDLGLRVPPNLILDVFRQVASALRYAHDARDEEGNPLSVVHRDLGPSNVMISREGTVKVIDFGVARLAGAGTESTNVNVFKGKFAYTAPEMLAGERAVRQSDLFTVGILMYEGLAGKHPFLAETIAGTLENVRHARVVPVRDLVPDVPPELADLVGALLQKDPAARPESAGEVLKRLDRVAMPPEAGVATTLDGFCRTLFRGTEYERSVESHEADWSLSGLRSRLLGKRRGPLATAFWIGLAVVFVVVAGGLLASNLWSYRVFFGGASGGALASAESPARPVARPSVPPANGTIDPTPLPPARVPPGKPVRPPKKTVQQLMEPVPGMPDRATVRLAVEPPGAVLIVDGKRVGEFASIRRFPSLDLDLEHSLRVEAPGYAPQEVRFRLAAKEVKEIDVSLVRLTGKVVVAANVPVDVYAGDSLIGRTPVTGTLYVGPHHLRMVNPDLGIDWTTDIRVEDGQTRKVEGAFYGWIECLDKNPRVSVLVDGQAAGSCDVILTVAPGRYRLGLRGLSAEVPDRDVVVRNRETVAVNW
jgi:serine/threonine-protein kinase